MGQIVCILHYSHPRYTENLSCLPYLLLDNIGKAAQTGSQAGVTRKLTGVVKIWEDPVTYVYDTPGITVPYFGEGEEASEKGLKLALTCGFLLYAHSWYFILGRQDLIASFRHHMQPA